MHFLSLFTIDTGFFAMRAILGMLVGGILGVPVSYFFQSGIVRAFVSLPQYTLEAYRLLPQVITSSTPTDAFSRSLQSALTTPVYSSVGVLAVLGLLIGYYLDQQYAKQVKKEQ